MYLAESYQRYIRNNRLDVYDTKPIKVPKPELYVVYPKDRKDHPDEISLAKEIFGISNPDNVFLDVRVKIIYDSKQGDILNQYITFCRVFDEQVKNYGRTEKAVTETIRFCKDQNVLKEYLSREEIPNIMFGYFDKEYQIELLKEAEREEGREEGRIIEAVEMYRELTDMDDSQIISALIKKFNISAEKAEEYVLSTTTA